MISFSRFVWKENQSIMVTMQEKPKQPARNALGSADTKYSSVPVKLTNLLLFCKKETIIFTCNKHKECVSHTVCVEGWSVFCTETIQMATNQNGLQTLSVYFIWGTGNLTRP